MQKLPVPADYDESYYRSGNYADYLQREPRYALAACEILGFFDTLNVPRPARVLDYGCGAGFLVKGFLVQGVKAVGYDWSPWVVRHAQDVLGIRGLTGDVRLLRQMRGVDLLTALDVFEHMTPDAIETILRRVQAKFLAVRVPVSLRSNEPYVLAVHNADKTHVLRWTKSDWLWFFEKMGYLEIGRPRLTYWYDSDGVYCGLLQRKA